ncbi:MAG: ribulose-phosphate 3-epimerase, partial [Synergistaceae bacterium]|nr:ribulose-phosphate 3-epimerase [Synergistaceae bacterium]
MTRNVLLAPSLLGADPLNIAGSIESLHNNFDWLHLDIMDGHFVKNLSFGPEFAHALRKRFPDSFIDTHLMIDKLDVILPLFIDAGVSNITIHAETESHLLHASLSRIRNAGIKAGIALCPPTPIANIKPVLELADLILVMSVTPGFGGQKFIESSLNKVRELVSL